MGWRFLTIYKMSLLANFNIYRVQAFFALLDIVAY